VESDERTYLLRVALAAQTLLGRLDTLTTQECSAGDDKPEREALRTALRGTPARHHEEETYADPHL